MPALVVAYLLAPPYVIVGLALATGFFVVLVVLRTARLLRQQELHNRRFASLVESSSDLVTLIDENTTILFVSPSAERLLGFDAGALEAARFVELIHPDEAVRTLEFILGGRSGAPHEMTLCRADGTWLATETLRTNLMHDESVRGIVLTSRDITERKAFLNQLEYHAFYDSLTGLANRALFRDRVNHALSQARRTSNSIAGLFLDVDDFKIVNDTHGHATGDALLTEIAEKARRRPRSCSATPTWRCTWRRTRARAAARSTSRPRTRRNEPTPAQGPPPARPRERRVRAPLPAARHARERGTSRGSRRSCAGSTPSAA